MCITDRLETLRIIGKPAPFVRAFIEAVDTAIRAHQPHHAMSATQRAWLAFCVTAVLVTNSICWARFERASLGTYSLAALSWMFRHSKIPWDHLLVASVRVILRHHGITSGSLVIDDTDNQRSTAATALAHLYKLRDKESGGYLWGQSWLTDKTQPLSFSGCFLVLKHKTRLATLSILLLRGHRWFRIRCAT